MARSCHHMALPCETCKSVSLWSFLGILWSLGFYSPGARPCPPMTLSCSAVNGLDLNQYLVKHCRATIWHPRAWPITGYWSERFPEKHDRAVIRHPRAAWRSGQYMKIRHSFMKSMIVQSEWHPRAMLNFWKIYEDFMSFWRSRECSQEAWPCVTKPRLEKRSEQPQNPDFFNFLFRGFVNRSIVIQINTKNTKNGLESGDLDQALKT